MWPNFVRVCRYVRIESGHVHLFNLQAIRTGNLVEVTAWLGTLPSGDEKKTILNTAKYNNSSTVLHLAAEYNQPKIAKLLLDEGAGRLERIVSRELAHR